MPDALTRVLPGLAMAKSYRPAWLGPDIAAGLVLTAVLVPVGMGYAEAAGLPAINGLYATIVPLLVYALFGPSKILVLGPDSSLAAVIAATIAPAGRGRSEPGDGAGRRARADLRGVRHRLRAAAPGTASRTCSRSPSASGTSTASP